MSTAPNVSIDRTINRQNSCSPDSLTSLANLVDETDSAMTFYFDSQATASCSHEAEQIRLQSVISGGRSAFASYRSKGSLEHDLDLIQLLTPEFRRHPHTFHALFASRNNGSQDYIALPLAAEIALLRWGRHFELLPLARAIQACAAYAVFLVENGKSRAFQVRGDHIEECEPLSQIADVSLHPHRERTGWPHHIDANAAERSDRFYRTFAENARDYLCDIGAHHLILGCRNDVWHKAQAELTRVGLNQADRFHLTTFDMTAAQVLENAKPMHVHQQELEHRAFWDALSADPSQSATGIEDILSCLQEGRVSRLFLGVVPELQILECADCNSWSQSGASTCTNCKSEALHPTPVAELLLRKALSTHAEIIAPPPELVGGAQVGALLRY